MFGDAVRTGLADPSGSLNAGAERSLGAAAAAGIRYPRTPQSVRVRRLRLRFELRRVAADASRASRVAGIGILRGTGQGRLGYCQNHQIADRDHLVIFKTATAVQAEPVSAD